MNPHLSQLHPYPFEKMAGLLAGLSPPPGVKPISLSIGEPAHPAPEVAMKALRNNLNLVSRYPATRGMPELRQAISQWAVQRFQLQSLDAESQILPVSGTREALFAIAQTVIDPGNQPVVLMPNPFYQIYEGATLLAGAQPVYLECLPSNNYQPDLDSITDKQWQSCQLFYLCSPGNPTGAVASVEYLQKLIQLADEHNFVIVSDECYSELYPDEDSPPAGLLQACADMARHDYHRCIVFHSLSKRSSLPGLRSGFVAGDAEILRAFLKYRTYHGAAMPLHHQMASIAAWSDEAHVQVNRALYREKFDAVLNVLTPVMKGSRPEAGFYLWPETAVSGEQFCRELYVQQGVTVLPGAYIGRDCGAGNPGHKRVRIALVAPLELCIEAAERIYRYLYN